MSTVQYYRARQLTRGGEHDRPDAGLSPDSKAWNDPAAWQGSTNLSRLTLRSCHDHVAVFVPDTPIPALWDSPVDAAPGATLIERIVAITGRTPKRARSTSWSPSASQDAARIALHE
jgi:hypothetical protein